MKVLITGITGMIGTHLAEYLQKQGHEVAGISRATSSLRMAAHRKLPYRHFAGDILDVNFLEKTVKSFQPEWVFHLGNPLTIALMLSFTGIVFKEKKS